MPRIRKHESSYLKMSKVWLVGPYVRLSKDDGNEESLSVTNQKKMITEYFEREFEEPYEIVDWYIDDGISGTTGDERVEFQRAVNDMKSGKINCLPCKTLSRAFRNYADQGYYLEQVFPTYHLRFISIGSPRVDTYLDPDAIIDGMEVPINGLMNDRYAAKTSQDVRRTFDMKRRRGEFIGAFAPYGLAKDPENKNQFIIDEEAAQVVRDIFSWYVNEGMSMRGITMRLNELGVPSPLFYKRSKGMNHKVPSMEKIKGEWAINTVSTLLSDEKYIGTMVQGKQGVISHKVKKKIAKREDEWYIVEGTHEAIIEREMFEKARALKLLNRRVPPGKRKSYLFSGFLRCPDCGKSMTKKTNRKISKAHQVKEYTYYVCSTYSLRNKNACTRHSISLEILTESVLTAVKAQISVVKGMADVIAEINKFDVTNNQSSRLKKQLADKQNELKKITHATDSLYMDWKCGDITKGEYMRMKLNFEEKADHLKSILANIEKEIESFSKGVGNDDPYLTAFLKNQNIETLNHGLLVELIDTIYIHENKEITIKFKFTNQHERILEFIENNQSKLESDSV